MAYVKNGVLVAGAASDAAIDRDMDYVDVCNVDGAAAIYFTTDGTAPDTSGTANDNYCLPATICSMKVKVNPATATTVKLKSTGTPAYSVTGIRQGAGR